MTAEKTIPLSVRVAPKTKTYLDTMAEKKGVGVARVLDQIIAELEDTPDSVYYLKYTTHFCFLSTFMLQRLLALGGHWETERSHFEYVQKTTARLFGPVPEPSKSFEKFDPATVPAVFEALYSVFDRLMPEGSPPSSPTPPQTAS